MEERKKQDERSAVLMTASMTTAKKAIKREPGDAEAASSSSGKKKRFVSQADEAITDLFASIKDNAAQRLRQRDEQLAIERMKAEAASRQNEMMMQFLMRMGGGMQPAYMPQQFPAQYVQAPLQPPPMTPVTPRSESAPAKAAAETEL